ncbi:hypothetical protein HNY73_011852 [Argiope bruennichi]|uniref:Uncharacterized protein n=1 Tax=Argiope bruennichi TaxID=94029 RepID=A0A8T0EUM8_ARGBR|nr:hypothetical protein HNY73_011852 [Argiope bruennichi]
MTNSLLKTSSSWFLRPLHLKQNAFENGFSSNKHSEIHIFLPPDEEYSIRKYCPLTLNHLLPISPIYERAKERRLRQQSADTINVEQGERNIWKNLIRVLSGSS